MGRFHDETFIRIRQIVFENLIYLGSTLEYWEIGWVRWWMTTKLFLNVSVSEYHTFSSVEFQKHSRVDNKTNLCIWKYSQCGLWRVRKIFNWEWILWESDHLTSMYSVRRGVYLKAIKNYQKILCLLVGPKL